MPAGRPPPSKLLTRTASVALAAPKHSRASPEGHRPHRNRSLRVSAPPHRRSRRSGKCPTDCTAYAGRFTQSKRRSYPVQPFAAARCQQTVTPFALRIAHVQRLERASGGPAKREASLFPAYYFADPIYRKSDFVLQRRHTQSRYMREEAQQHCRTKNPSCLPTVQSQSKMRLTRD